MNEFIKGGLEEAEKMGKKVNAKGLKEVEKLGKKVNVVCILEQDHKMCDFGRPF